MRIQFLLPLLLLSDFSPAPRSRFFVFVSGHTGAHRDFVKKLKRRGLTEVDNDEDCDYVLVFCPVASRVGTDVGEALRKAPAGKATVLVVMHHTFDHDYVLADSRRLVDDPNVQLTVDCLFYEDHLLDCQRNDDSLSTVQKHLSASWVRPGPLIPDRPTSRCSMRRVICGSVIVVAVVVISIVIFVITKKLM